MRKVPKLRFKEFSDEWEEKKLGEISEITSGLTPLRSEEKFYLNGIIPWIKTSDLNNSYIKETEEKISEIALKETSIKLLPKNTLLVAMYGGFNQIGRTGLTTMEATTNQALSAIKFKDINKFPLFFQNILNYKVDYWKKVSASSRKDPNISKKDIEDFKVFYPRLEEQEKIATFLSSIDKKISLTEEKLELFREYKKGVMQKIFSQELRFKDSNGNDYPEWEEKRLEEILESGSKERVENIKNYQKITIKLNLKGIEKNFSKREMADTRPFYIRELNEIIIGKQNYFNGSIAIITREFAGCICSNAIMSFKVRKGNVKFIYLYLSQRDYMKKREFLANGTGQKELSEKEFLNFVIKLPILEEQQKIVYFLSSIDSKIESIEKELDELKRLKKGLLQQIFV
jgi:type I restriction enzyme S subunit